MEVNLKELAIVDDERDVGHFRILDLDVVHHEDLGRGLPHQPSRRVSKPVQSSQLGRSVHIAMLRGVNTHILAITEFTC